MIRLTKRRRMAALEEETPGATGEDAATTVGEPSELPYGGDISAAMKVRTIVLFYLSRVVLTLARRADPVVGVLMG